ncbi:MAG: polyketide cyclase [Chitinophagaceae bacterium]|nr:MAG: polyketide cyclase [Chitinophagaceae bacterium]
MNTTATTPISINTTVNAPVEKVWAVWSDPEHIVQWNSASPDWHTPRATNDLKKGGKFTSRMEAKDGSMGFDFEGVYDEVEINKLIAYTMADGRKVKTIFTGEGNTTQINTEFDPETENSREMQQMGWQAILDNFKMYTEQL